MITLVLVAVALYGLSRAFSGAGSPVSFAVESDNRIDLTPNQITSIRKIGKWEFLSVQMEEIIDTTRSRILLSDDELIRIYRGTIRLGIDMEQLDDDWFSSRGDTAVLHLPPVRQLNEQFIDEAATQTFYESGTWSHAAREQMYREAERRMKKRLAAGYAYEQAEENGREQLTALMRTFGFRHAEVSFGNK